MDILRALQNQKKQSLIKIIIKAINDCWQIEMIESGLKKSLKENSDVIIKKKEWVIEKLNEWGIK